MVDSFAVARNAVMAGDAVGLAPLVALEQDLRARQIALLPFTAPWLQLSYGLFYTRKRPLSRVAQLFMTQLRQAEVVLQAREQRALARLEGKRRARRSAAKRKAKATAESAVGVAKPTTAAAGRRTRTRQ
jgi:hypothetical protein